MKLAISYPRCMDLRCTLEKLLDKMPIDHTISLVTRLVCILQTIKTNVIKNKKWRRYSTNWNGAFLRTFQDHDISSNEYLKEIFQASKRDQASKWVSARAEKFYCVAVFKVNSFLATIPLLTTPEEIRKPLVVNNRLTISYCISIQIIDIFFVIRAGGKSWLTH